MSASTPETITVGRRQFTIEAVLALLAGVTITITGCGGSDSPTPVSPTPTPTPPPSTSGGAQQDASGVVSENHGHIAIATAGQITAANAVTVDIHGNATHGHNISLSGDQLRAIGSRQRVAVTSTTDVGHQHTVTFN